jgi:hypothetical protein
MLSADIYAHRAPDPVPSEEPPPDPFEGTDPHQAPIRTPLNDEPVPDHNPSVTRSFAASHGNCGALGWKM